MKKYTVGIDFGTLSGRAVLVDVTNGAEVASVVMDYPNAVISTTLPASGEALPLNWALEDPRDYVAVLEYLFPALCREAGIVKEQIVGVGIDFTCCTVLPIKKDGTALVCLPEFEKNKHAYVKLWKHHAAQDWADRMNEVAAERGETFVNYFGGKISSEWLFPKLLQTAKEAPEVIEAADYYIEAGDWLNLLLTGEQKRGYLFASFKAEYLPEVGYPSDEYLAAVDPELPALAHRLFDAPIAQMGECVGRVTKEAAERFGLAEGTAVAASISSSAMASMRPAKAITCRSSATSCSLTAGEVAYTIIPSPTETGVFCIMRMTGMPSPTTSLISEILTPAAMLTTATASFLCASAGRSCSSTCATR